MLITCWLWSAIESYLCFSHSYLWPFLFLPVSAVRFWLDVCFATTSCTGSYFIKVWMLFYCFLLVQANRKSYVDLFKFKFKQLINSCRKSGSSGSGVPPFPWPPSKSENFMHVSLQLCWEMDMCPSYLASGFVPANRRGNTSGLQTGGGEHLSSVRCHLVPREQHCAATLL